MTTIFFEDPNILRACLERAARFCISAGEWMGNDVFHADIRRLPSMVGFEATVQPVDVAIGSRECSDLFCGQKIRDSCIAQDRDILVARIAPQVELTLMTPELFESLFSRIS